eukprot:Nitzschia sp. Nitz4//scaffold141_size107518//58724//59807//NITZ4_004280-RA/size107518-augustus-gene-0.81-mRNA-1//1//CDS//3329536300//8933//frame0
MTNNKKAKMDKKKNSPPSRHFSNQHADEPTFEAANEEKIDVNIFDVDTGLHPSQVGLTGNTSPSNHSLSQPPIANTPISPGNGRKRRHRERSGGSEGGSSYDVSLLGDFEPPEAAGGGGWHHSSQPDQAPPVWLVAAPTSRADESSTMGLVPHLPHAKVEDLCTRRLKEELGGGNHPHRHLRGLASNRGMPSSSSSVVEQGGHAGSGHGAGKAKSHQKRGGRSHQDLTTHMLLENTGKKSTNCYLCTIMTTDNTKRTSIYSCVQCERGFHVNCFSLYHFQDEMAKHRPALVQLMQVREESGKKKRRRRANTLTSNMKEFRVPFPI